MYVGVMCYQGGGALHIAALQVLGIKYKSVKYSEDITDDLTALILPGGESSAQYKHCVEYGLDLKIKEFANSGRVMLGTCAGLILLSSYKSELVSGFGILDIDIQRNIYGRQNVSGEMVSDNGNKVSFIRAPGVSSIGKNVQVLDTYKGKPILLSSGLIYGATFHPELSEDLSQYAALLYQHIHNE